MIFKRYALTIIFHQSNSTQIGVGTPNGFVHAYWVGRILFDYVDTIPRVYHSSPLTPHMIYYC